MCGDSRWQRWPAGIVVRTPFAEGQSLDLAAETLALGAPGGVDFVERSKGRRPCVGADGFDAGVTHARALP